LPSVNVHALESVPFVSFYVNRDAMRVICHREGSTLVLLHVADHDSAYAWARRHRVATVGSYVRIVRSSIEDDGARPPEPGGRSDGPLAASTDADLKRFDVHAPTAALLRSVPDVDSLLDLLTHFPPARGEALLALATDSDRLDAIEEAYRAALARPPEPPSLAE